jgi:two-component system, LytTR family, sensor kinase
VHARVQGAQLLVRVSDNGIGLDPRAKPGMGLNNLRARLAALHGDAAGLSLSEVSPHGLCAEVHLPLSMAVAGAPAEAW